MSGSEATHSGLTRRNFLKATGATIGVAAAGMGGALTLSSAPAVAESGADDGEEIFYNFCSGNCSGGCRIKIKKRNGIVYQTEMAEYPIEGYNRICGKGLSHPQRIYSKDRIKYPMRRVGERGSDDFERISWDEAIDEISSTWKSLIEQYGAKSIVFSAGTGGAPNVGAINYLCGEMGASYASGSYDNAGLTQESRVMGFGDYITGNSPHSTQYARVGLLWGTNSVTSYVQDFHWWYDARERNGTKLIHIDPCYNPTTSKCDYHLPIKPGTDAVLFMGMINEVLKNDWIDKEFVSSLTVAPYLVKSEDGLFLRRSDLGIPAEEGPIDPWTGEPAIIDPIMTWDSSTEGIQEADLAIDPALYGSYEIEGKKVTTALTLLEEAVSEWPIETAAALCELDADVVKEMTRMIAQEGPVTAMLGYGVDHYNGSHHAYHALISLMALTGNFGKIGAGFAGDSYIASLVSEPGSDGIITFGPGALTSINLLAAFKNKEFAGQPIDIHSLFIFGHNLMTNMTGRKEFAEMFDQLDLVVTSDIEMTDTCRYSDIVLPACHWFEQESLCNANIVPCLVHREKALDPLYESKSDFEIGGLLADAMGYPLPWTFEEFLEGHFESDFCKEAGLTLERLREEKVVVGPNDGMSIHGEGFFPTGTGRVEFYLESIDTSSLDTPDAEYMEQNMDTERLPSWEPPHEAWSENPLHEKYPLSFTSIRNRFRTHSQFFSCPWLLEVVPEPTLRLNPDDASSRGISNGDYVRAFNDRGEVVLLAQIDNGLRPGMVVYPKGWQEFEHVKGAPSDLASGYTHPSAYNAYNFDVLCEVEKYEV